MTIAAVKTARAANSQGGAIAILACTYFRVNGIPCDIYSFGSPRVGNSAFSNFVNNQVGSHFRVTHTNDPVPNLPTSWFGWRHSGTEFWLSTGTSNTMAYELKDVVVCAGIDNNDCNGSTKSLDLLAHQTYFQNVQACL
jgi:predicted lipase